MDALKGFMLYLDQLRAMLAPILTQGTAALDPLVRAYPWPFLFGAFVFGITAMTAFRVMTGMLARLLLLPFILIAGYLLYSSGGQVVNMFTPLLQNKLSGVF